MSASATSDVLGRPRLVKIVRDRIGSLLGGSEVHYAPVADREQAIGMLRRKLVEEATEYLLSPSRDELADVLEVCRSLADLDLDCAWSAVELEATLKRQDRGGFRELMGMWCTTLADREFEGEHPDLEPMRP